MIRRPVWKHPSLVATALVLGLSLGLQAWGGLRETPQPRPPHLRDIVPPVLSGWSVRQVPLGPNEFVSGEVQKILNYDDVLNIEFNRGSETVGLYAAYWGPGKMPTRMVASHTPDRCWTENGWTCNEMRFSEEMKVDDHLLLPAQWRRFTPPGGGKAVYVYFWHLVDGRLHDYGERFNAVPHPAEWWKDAVGQIVSGSREQYFIRLTSSVPFERIWQDPSLAPLLRSLRDLGLEAPAGGASR